MVGQAAGSARGGLFPAQLRHWRRQRGMSQLDLALAADVSSRHVSFLETGRSAPSAEMVLRLATALDVPLRQVNAMLRAAHHPEHYPEAGPVDEPPPEVQETLRLMKDHHEPFPLLVLDRAYRILDLNAGARAVLGEALPALDGQELVGANLARLTLDPQVGGRIVHDHAAVARALLWRLQHELLADPGHEALRSLLDDVLATPGLPEDWRAVDPTSPSEPTLDLRLAVGDALWSFRLVVSVLQAPLQVGLEDVRVEQWFPADQVTALACERLLRR